MSIKKNELALLIALLGALVAVAVYVFVFNPYRDKTDALKAENRTQAEYLAKLEDWASRMEQMQSDTERMLGEVNQTFARFPVQSKAEDAIMYAVELESQDPDTYISSIGLTAPEMVYEAAPTSVRLHKDDELTTHTYKLYKQAISYTQEFTYNGMKRYVNSIVKDSNRKSIETLNMAYDRSTGILVGSTLMNLYTLSGTEEEYEKTSIPPRPMGTNNIFGTLQQTYTPHVEGEED